jgi:hypothetical protein
MRISAIAAGNGRGVRARCIKWRSLGSLGALAKVGKRN